MRVLVSAELASFLADTPVPGDLDVELLPPDAATPAGELVGIIPLITRRVGAAEMERLPRLRVIANYGVGYDNIDVPAARARGIRVGNTPGVLTGATAELTWALILAVTRRLGEGERLVRAGAWTGWEPTQLLGTSLEGKLLGIVGAGRIGREVGRRARAFGMDLAYWSRSPQQAWERETGARRLELERLLGEADVVSVHVALAPDTDPLIDAAALRRMKAGAYLVNTARGRVIDEEALIAALRDRRIAGAGLDVYAREPLVPEALRVLDNAVLLPHLGSSTVEARRGMWRLAWANLLAGVRGEPLPNEVTDAAAG